ncbi:MAG: hypothetical protein M1831_003915 [Alyxoria varia]|nr:MAG: hypothetical protein M1831_003915 [Alyxoria varia]
MSSLRNMTAMDLLGFARCNLDPLTETYGIEFYMHYLASWPHLCFVMVDSQDHIEGYLLGKVESSPKNNYHTSAGEYDPDTNKNLHYLPWHVHITALTVSPESRRRGHARKLTEALERQGDVERAWFVDLYVRSDNTNAISLYQSMGYSVFRRVVGYYQDGADAFDMRKSLLRDEKMKHIRSDGRNFHVSPEVPRCSVMFTDPLASKNHSIKAHGWCSELDEMMEHWGDTDLDDETAPEDPINSVEGTDRVMYHFLTGLDAVGKEYHDHMNEKCFQYRLAWRYKVMGFKDKEYYEVLEMENLFKFFVANENNLLNTLAPWEKGRLIPIASKEFIPNDESEEKQLKSGALPPEYIPQKDKGEESVKRADSPTDSEKTLCGPDESGSKAGNLPPPYTPSQEKRDENAKQGVSVATPPPGSDKTAVNANDSGWIPSGLPPPYTPRDDKGDENVKQDDSPPIPSPGSGKTAVEGDGPAETSLASTSNIHDAESSKQLHGSEGEAVEGDDTWPKPGTSQPSQSKKKKHRSKPKTDASHQTQTAEKVESSEGGVKAPVSSQEAERTQNTSVGLGQATEPAKLDKDGKRPNAEIGGGDPSADETADSDKSATENTLRNRMKREKEKQRRKRKADKHLKTPETSKKQTSKPKQNQETSVGLVKSAEHPASSEPEPSQETSVGLEPSAEHPEGLDFDAKHTSEPEAKQVTSVSLGPVQHENQETEEQEERIHSSPKDIGTDLRKAVGARIRLTTVPPSKALEGTIFTVDPITNLIAINTARDASGTNGDYHVFLVSRVASFTILSLDPGAESTSAIPKFADAKPEIAPVDTRVLRAREEVAIRKAREAEAKRKKGVSKKPETESHQETSAELGKSGEQHGGLQSDEKDVDTGGATPGAELEPTRETKVEVEPNPDAEMEAEPAPEVSKIEAEPDQGPDMEIEPDREEPEYDADPNREESEMDVEPAQGSEAGLELPADYPRQRGPFFDGVYHTNGGIRFGSSLQETSQNLGFSISGGRLEDSPLRERPNVTFGSSGIYSDDHETTSEDV